MMFLWGGLGGTIPVIAALLANKGYPLIDYWVIGPSAEVIRSAIFELVKVAALFLIGGAWAYLNKAEDAMKAFQLGVAAPAVIVGFVATNDARKVTEEDPQLRTTAPAPNARTSQINFVIAGAPPPHLTNPVVPIQFSNLSDTVPLEDLPRLFSGVERRLASDRLISLYPSNKSAVVNAVIAAIEPQSSSTSYRVNIYVARTLRLIPGKWEGTKSQRDAIANLKNRNSYKDITFKENVDGALENWKEIN